MDRILQCLVDLGVNENDLNNVIKDLAPEIEDYIQRNKNLLPEESLKTLFLLFISYVIFSEAVKSGWEYGIKIRLPRGSV